MDYLTKVKEAAQALKEVFKGVKPDLFCQFGTGTADLLESYPKISEVRYRDIPHFLTPSAPFHEGTLNIYMIDDKPVGVLKGRFHYYEGYSMRDIVLPVYALKLAGISQLVLTNASGSVSHIPQSSLVVIKDHINLMYDNPLRGVNYEELGPRFPSMESPYDLIGIEKIKSIANDHHISIYEGIYLGLCGPNFETNAEYKAAQILGADLIGMSTIPEVIASNHCGLKVNAISIVSNQYGHPVTENMTAIDQIIENVKVASKPLKNIIHHLVSGSIQ